MLLDNGETESINSVGTDRSSVSESTKPSSALSNASKPKKDAKDAQPKVEPTATRPPSTSQSTLPAKSKTAKRKGSSIFGFFTIKEPSAAALASFEEYTRKRAATSRRGERANGSGMPGISTAKMPANVPPVNSKWDGIPKALKGREKIRSRDRNTFSQMSTTRSRTKSVSRPSTARSSTSIGARRTAQSREVTSPEINDIRNAASTPSSIQTIVQESKTSQPQTQSQASTPLANPTEVGKKSLEQRRSQTPEPAMVCTQIRDSYFLPEAVASNTLRRNSLDLLVNNRDSISLLIDEFPPTPMGPGGLAFVQSQRQRTNSVASPPPTPPAVSEELGSLNRGSGTSSRPGTAKKTPKKVEMSIYPSPDRTMTTGPQTVQQLRAKRSLQHLPSLSSRSTSRGTHKTSISSTNSSLSSKQWYLPSKPHEPATHPPEGLGLGLASLDTNRIFVNAEAERPRDKFIAPWDESEQVMPLQSSGPARPRSRGGNRKRRTSVVR
jgi:hypothetical protein